MNGILELHLRKHFANTLLGKLLGLDGGQHFRVGALDQPNQLLSLLTLCAALQNNLQGIGHRYVMIQTIDIMEALKARCTMSFHFFQHMPGIAEPGL